MSSIHYFQRYSTKENVITNNTLLLFSRLYNESPLKFKLFLISLDNIIDLNVGVSFSQQERGNGSVPDGNISQESFKIAIETKQTDKFDLVQLVNHFKAFGNEKTQILLGLGPKKMNDIEKDEIFKALKDFNENHKKNIQFSTVTFEEIVKVFKEVISEYDFELNDIINEYEEFCIKESVIRNDEYRMLAVPCGDSIEQNLKHNLYFCPVERTVSTCSYIGTYYKGKINAVGKIENIVTADLNESGELNIIESTQKLVTETQKANIVSIIKAIKETIGWDISNGKKFFCVEKFVDTDFKKTSLKGLMGKKYFDLKTILNKNNFTNTEEIAELLKTVNWDGKKNIEII